MTDSIQSVRGMHDTLPVDTLKWQMVEKVLRSTMLLYGYQEIRTPIVESTALFCRSIGEVTDIVEKEMYTFNDRNNDSLTLRPEGTASCVRAGIQHGLFHNQVQRLWYTGPMFRHERPQKGRYRQFHQFGIEVFGMADPDIEAELIFIGERLWRKLGIKNITLQINTLGNTEARHKYRKILVSYFHSRSDELDDDSKRRLNTNPLRILDSKNPDMKTVLSDAPDMFDSLDDESLNHFDQLKTFLDNSNVTYEINSRLVRGLDYYGKTVFEWVTSEEGAQNTLCAGGRYDGLVEQLGGKRTPAAGFAVGIERLLGLIATNTVADEPKYTSLYIVMQGSTAIQNGLIMAEELRDKLHGGPVIANCGGGSLKSQMKKADKSGADIALIVGEDETSKQQVTVKHLRTKIEQISVDRESITEYLIKL